MGSSTFVLIQLADGLKMWYSFIPSLIRRLINYFPKLCWAITFPGPQTLGMLISFGFKRHRVLKETGMPTCQQLWFRR